jgi:hypothetical protein
LKTTYTSTDTPIFNNSIFKIVPALTVIPKFGIRRNFAKHFNYEFSFGVGYQYNIFDDKIGCNCSHENTDIDIQTRIGYNF